MGNVRVWLDTMTTEKREYTLNHTPKHLAQAGYVNQLFGCLTSFKFIQAKLLVCGVEALIEDYELGLNSANIILSEAQTETLRLIQGAIRLSSHILKADQTQLAAQLLGRLLEFENPLIQNFLEDIKINQTTPWLRPLEGSLTKPDSPLLRTLVGHTDEILALEVTPDSQWLISGSEDHTIKVWDIATGQEIYTLTGHTGSVLTLVLTSDGKQVISGSADHTIKVWSLETGQEIYTLRGHQGIIPTLALSSDGKILYSGSEDKTVKLWSLETQQEIASFECQQSILSLAVTPDNKKLIACLQDGFLQIWDLKKLNLIENWVICKIKNKQISLYKINSNILNFITEYYQIQRDFNDNEIFLCDDLTILSVENKSCILHISYENLPLHWTSSFICKINFDRQEINIEFELESDKGATAQLTPNNKQLIYSYCCYEYGLTPYILATQTIIINLKNKQQINTLNKYFYLFTLNYNENIFIGTIEDDIQIFDWNKMLIFTEKENPKIIHPTYLDITNDGKWLIVYYHDEHNLEYFMLYSLQSMRLYIEEEFNYMKISSDSKYIFWKPFLSDSAYLKVYDLKKNEVILNLEGESKVNSFSSKTTKIHDNFLFTIDNHKFLVYDLQDQDNIRELDEKIINFHILEGTSKFIICLPDKSINFIDVEENRIIEFDQYKEEKYIFIEEQILESRKTNSLEEDDDLFFSLDTYKILPYIESVLANDKFSISGYYGGYSGNTERPEKIIWNIETGEKLFTLDGKFITVTPNTKKAIFYGLKDSKNIRNESIFHTLIIWSLEQIYTITNNTASIKFIDVTKDSKLLLIQTFEKNNDAIIHNLEVWSLETGQQVYTINLTGAILFVQINTDNSRMLVATDDQYLRIFNLQTGKEIFKIKNQWGDAQKEVTITPDFKEVISIYKGNNLIVWDLETGKVKATFTADNPLACYTISPDGKTIVAAEIFGKLHFLTLEDEE
jgi:FOG: WD40 repeat